MTTQTMVQCKRVMKLMGNRFEFTIIVEDVDFGEHAIDLAIGEIKRIEELLSTKGLHFGMDLSKYKLDEE